MIASIYDVNGRWLEDLTGAFKGGSFTHMVGGIELPFGIALFQQSKTIACDESLCTKRKVLEAMTAYFGSQAASPVAYTEMNWQAEAYSAGGYTGYCPPGVLTGFASSWRAATGRVHWAGTETSTIWAGYMEGAVRSGERAAQEVLAL